MTVGVTSPGVWRRRLGVCGMLLAAACGSSSRDDLLPSTIPPTLPPPAPRVRVQRVLDTAWSREPAIGDTLRLTAAYLDASGAVVPARPVSWSLERPSAYYTLSADGVVVPIKAGDGASFTQVQARIDGILGVYSLSYRVLGWLVDTTFDAALQRSEVRARLAGRFAAATVPANRRRGLNSDWDANLSVRCRGAGGLALQLEFPEAARDGVVTFRIAGSEVITESWTISGDGHTLVRPDEGSTLLSRLTAAREFSLAYTTASGTAISGILPGREPVVAITTMLQHCR